MPFDSARGDALGSVAVWASVVPGSAATWLVRERWAMEVTDMQPLIRLAVPVGCVVSAVAPRARAPTARPVARRLDPIARS